MAQATVALRFTKDFSNVRLRVSTASNLSNPIRSAPHSTTSGMVKITMTGLQPDTQYFYGVEISGVLQNEGRGKFKTFPAGPASFECMFSSCCLTGNDSSIFDIIRNQNPLFFIHMGDLHYEDIGSNDKTRFHRAYDQVFSAPRQHAFYSNIPTMYVWDDHDFGGNNSDGTSAARPAAQAAYRERVPHYLLPSSNGAIYQSWVVGRVRFIMTDLRSNSSRISNSDNSSKTKMGEEQIQWFFNELLKPEPVKVWISSHAWITPQESNTDKWGSYSTERKRIANFIKNNGLEGKVMIISGDMHGIALDRGRNADYADGGGADIPVLQSAPLKQSSSVKGGPYDLGTYTNGSNGHQYGRLIVTDTGGSTITIKMEGRRDLVTLVSHTVTIPAT